jgi:adenylyl cyclase-associated protein
MHKYAKEHYTTGLVWNAKVPHPLHPVNRQRSNSATQGIPYDQFKPLTASGPAAGAPGAPPPPPPPPPPKAAAAAPAPGGGAAAVFAEINRGEDVTKGLRKVDKSEMTHKNPALRASSTVPASSSTSPVGKKPIKPTKPSALAGKKPPKFTLEGNKWLIVCAFCSGYTNSFC